MEKLYSLFKQNFAWLVVIIVLASVIPRLVNIQESLLSLQPFRQTQTAITVREFVNNGVDPLYYETPIFGPPFYCPFEFPIFQITAWLFYKIGLSDLDTACRATSVFYYLLSAIMLLLIVHTFFQSKLVSIATITQFAFLPFSICWSRNSLIEYCVLFFCLLYLFLFLKFREFKYKAWFLLFVTAAVGILGFMSKGTTAFAYALIVLLIMMHDFFAASKYDYITSKSINLEHTGVYVFAGFFVLLVPFVFLYLWTRHTDLLKMESVFSYATTSKSLHDWNFGLMKDKLSVDKWIVILQRAFTTISFAVVIAPVMIFPAIINKHLRNRAITILLLTLVVVATIFTFFNLYYIHDYYLNAVLPILCVISALVLKLILEAHIASKSMFSVLLFCLILSFSVFAFYGVSANEEYVRFFTCDKKREDYESYRIAKQIEKLTQKKDLVIVTDFEWSSEVLYYANRKGLMWNDWNNTFLDRYKENIQCGQYRLLVTKNPKNNKALLDCFKLSLLSEKENTYYYSIIGLKL